MARGFKTGGRMPGTPNANKKELSTMILEKYPNYHPVMALVDIANNSELDIILRFQANKEVAKYLCPQLKSIDISSEDMAPAKFTITVKDEATRKRLEEI